MGVTTVQNRYLNANVKFPGGITEQEIERNIHEYFRDYSMVKNILILPPDMSRLNSYAGNIVNILYRYFHKTDIDIMPALGTHIPMSENEIRKMYGFILYNRFIAHDWRNDTVKIGEVPASFVKEISEGYMDVGIDVEVNKRLLDRKYDLIISVGQVVPHEVAGFANYTKNILVGCGGRNMINQSHYLGALYGMERIMGRIDNPVRKLYNYAAYKFLSHIPLVYILTVTTLDKTGLRVEAVSIGTGDEVFSETAKVSQKKNLSFLHKPVKKVVVYLDPEKFRTTWVGNKSIYRTRMAIADGGEILVIAPALQGCGEDLDNDRLINRYGYLTRDQVIEAVSNDEDLRNNLSVAAHLIHGSSEGRFKITYAPGKMTKEQILSIKYDYLPLEEALKMYDVNRLRDGFNTVGGEEIFYLSDPAIGLWTTRSRFEQYSEGNLIKC
ncbi:D-mannonate epimerase [Clostridiales bacterium PH28_bin88]|nr:D-mannonate epimerase [Clostridiales bacterium PH28_bin88]